MVPSQWIAGGGGNFSKSARHCRKHSILIISVALHLAFRLQRLRHAFRHLLQLARNTIQNRVGFEQHYHLNQHVRCAHLRVLTKAFRFLPRLKATSSLSLPPPLHTLTQPQHIPPLELHSSTASLDRGAQQAECSLHTRLGVFAYPAPQGRQPVPRLCKPITSIARKREATARQQAATAQHTTNHFKNMHTHCQILLTTLDLGSLLVYPPSLPFARPETATTLRLHMRLLRDLPRHERASRKHILAENPRLLPTICHVNHAMGRPH